MYTFWPLLNPDTEVLDSSLCPWNILKLWRFHFSATGSSVFWVGCMAAGLQRSRQWIREIILWILWGSWEYTLIDTKRSKCIHAGLLIEAPTKMFWPRAKSNMLRCDRHLLVQQLNEICLVFPWSRSQNLQIYVYILTMYYFGVKNKNSNNIL